MPRYIDADELVKVVEKESNQDGAYGYMDTKSIVDLINDVPTADVVERKVGKWVEPTRDGCITYDKHAYAECSACGKKSYLGWGMFYCPNCGARMERREDE